MTKSSPPLDQYLKFKDTVRSIGADESEAAFEEKLAKLGKHKPVKAEKSE